jgi:LAO/AO transport system kinase
MEHPENNEAFKGLKVNDGVECLGPVNPYLSQMRRSRAAKLSVNDYVEGVLKGDVTVLSRAVTLLESSLPEHQAMAQEVVDKCLPYSGNSLRVGITGVPGAGKSTSIDAFGMYLLSNTDGKLAVLAVDPSSERSKGSILGDKTRMERLSVHPRAFIRPSASAGSLGGVARKTRETIVLCEAAGYDNIFVETVGVGQSETAVCSMVDFFLLIQIAGAGDELQGIKRGIMEMADGIVINKADGDNVEEARRAAVHYRNALQLFPMPAYGMRPQVLTYSGFFDLGIDAVWDMINGCVGRMRETGYFDERRCKQQRYWMYEAIEEQLKNRFYNMQGMDAMLSRYEQLLLTGKITSFAAAGKVLDFFDKNGNNG